MFTAGELEGTLALPSGPSASKLRDRQPASGRAAAMSLRQTTDRSRRNERSVSHSQHHNCSVGPRSDFDFTGGRVRRLIKVDLGVRAFISKEYFKAGPRDRCPSASGLFAYFICGRGRPMPTQVWALATSIGWTVIVAMILLYIIFSPS